MSKITKYKNIPGYIIKTAFNTFEKEKQIKPFIITDSIIDTGIIHITEEIINNKISLIPYFIKENIDKFYLIMDSSYFIKIPLTKKLINYNIKNNKTIYILSGIYNNKSFDYKFELGKISFTYENDTVKNVESEKIENINIPHFLR